MNFILHLWQFLLAVLAGWINDEQQKLIEYLRTENQVLKEKLGRQRILLNDDQRRRIAVKGKILGSKLLAEIGCLFTPDTILRWHRQLVLPVAILLLRSLVASPALSGTASAENLC